MASSEAEGAVPCLSTDGCIMVKAFGASMASSLGATGDEVMRLDSLRPLGLRGACCRALALAALRLSESVEADGGREACEGLGGGGGAWVHVCALDLRGVFDVVGDEDAAGCSVGFPSAVAGVTNLELSAKVADVGCLDVEASLLEVSAFPADGLEESSDSSVSESESSGTAKWPDKLVIGVPSASRSSLFFGVAAADRLRAAAFSADVFC